MNQLNADELFQIIGEQTVTPIKKVIPQPKRVLVKSLKKRIKNDSSR